MLRGHVDRGFAKAVAWKRTITGTFSLAGSAVMVMIAVARSDQPRMAIVGACIFAATGIWALRDGVRLLKEIYR
jgi:hypothetical protein